VVYEFCGHGVGIEFHEDPQVDHVGRKNSGPLMKPGMIFTIEPMINMGKPRVTVDRIDGWTARTIDNKLSAQYEHTVLVTETGVEVLTDVNGEY
jgi:methionyl aminopeptidase